MPDLEAPVLAHARRNAVAYVALFVALGGTSYAAVKLPKNSVGATQIKTNAVRSAEVKNGSLTAKDFKKGVIKVGAQGPAGKAGANGLNGAPGAKGADGAAGPAGMAFLAQASGGSMTSSPDRTVDTTLPFTMPKEGRVRLYGTGLMFMNTLCPGGGSPLVSVGLFLDDSFVPGTVKITESGPGSIRQNFVFDTVTAPNVAAGDHTVKVKYDCDNGGATPDASPSSFTLGAMRIDG